VRHPVYKLNNRLAPANASKIESHTYALKPLNNGVNATSGGYIGSPMSLGSPMALFKNHTGKSEVAELT
jgi:hypothetical protein